MADKARRLAHLRELASTVASAAADARTSGDARHVREDAIVDPTVKQVGAIAWFEYHCEQSHESAHAAAWYRSHQPVVVVHRKRFEDENGPRHGYRVRFADGYAQQAFDDELYDVHEDFFARPQAVVAGGFAPPALHEIRAHEPELAAFLSAQRLAGAIGGR